MAEGSQSQSCLRFLEGLEMFTNQDPDLWENVKRTNENPQIFDVQMWGSGNSGIGHNQPQRMG